MMLAQFPLIANAALPIDSLESLTRNESADDDGVGGSSGLHTKHTKAHLLLVVLV